MTEVRQVVCYGDSNTHGTCPMDTLDDVRRFGPDIRWTAALRKALPPHLALVEEGHPGRTTVFDDPIEGAYKNGQRALQAILETHREVALVVLKLGTNDLKARLGVGAQDIALATERLLDTIAASACGPGLGAPRVLLVAPPPIEEVGCLAEMFDGGAAKSRRLGGLLREVATRRRIGFVDAGAHINVSPVDGIHYDAEAHEALGSAIAGAVQVWLD